MRKRKNYGLFSLFGVLIIFFVALGLSIWYAIFQYNLCYPEVSDSFWYCFQHAFGG